MGVDLLGFSVVEGRPGSVSAKTFQEIRGWITGPQIVAEIYGLETADQLKTIIEETHPDFLEMSLKEYAIVGHLVTLPYILNVTGGQELPAELATSPAYLLADLPVSEQTSKFIPEFELLIQLGNSADLEAALAQTGITGIALTGGSEIRPGLKEYDALADILEALEED